MVVEYILLLVISTLLLIGGFGFKTGPLGMMKDRSPALAYHIQSKLQTGEGFPIKERP